MNEHDEHRFGQSVHKALEASAQRLPYRVVMRLEKSRNEALARMPGERPLARTAEAPRRDAASLTVSADGTASFDPGSDGDLPRWMRVAFTLIPIVAVVAGLALIADRVDADRASEIVEIDVAVLVDDLPISAYTDRGFGVFLNNVHRQ